MKSIVTRGLVIAGIAGVILLSWSFVEPASAKQGYSCNPDAGHGNPGCHVTVTTSPPATVPPATAPPATNPPATSPPGTRPTAGTTATLANPTATSGESTTTVPESSATTTDSAGAVAAGTSGTGGGGGTGLGGGLAAVWIATAAGLGALVGAGLAVSLMKQARRRRISAFQGTSASGPVRFVLAERLAHWFYALCFLVAGISGALMWIPSTERWLAEAGYTVSKYHGYVGLAMVIVPFLIFLIIDRRRLAQNRREVGSWDANDRLWLWRALSGGMLRGKKMPPQGRFNAGQKVNTHLVAGLALGFVSTGALLLLRVHLPVWLMPGVLFAHQVLAVTGGVLLFGHLGMALFTKHGRGGLRAMVGGVLPARLAREGHAIWYAEWLRQKDMK